MDKNALIANTATNFPDNTAGDIEPSNSRNNAEQIITACANLNELTEQEFLGPIKFSGTVTGAGAYYTEFVRSTSEVTQAGGALDVKKGIVFGDTTVTSPNGEFRINDDGTIDILKSGPIFFKQVAEIGRSGSSGNVEAFFQVEVSVDGGSTWLPQGGTLNRRISNPNSVNVFIDVAPVFVSAGLKFRTVWIQSSVGGDPSDPTVGVADASLIYASPSAAALAAGINPSPSAAAVLYGLTGYGYE